MAATATLASKTVTVTPGGEAVTEVRVRNSGTIVDQFTLEVLGDASAWAIVEPAVIPLFPGAEAVARIKFKPPKSSSVPSRAIPFAVRVKSREDARASLVEEGVVEVGPFNDTFAELIPRTARGSTRARAQLALDNRGNVRVNARLTAADPDRKLNFTISPQALTAEPGTAAFASIRVSPRQRYLTGPPKLNPYKVLVHQDGLPTITVDGSMQQEGMIPRWFIPAAIAALAVALVLAILWFTVVRKAITDTAQDAAQNAPAVQQAKNISQQALNKVNALPNVSPTAAPGIVGPNGGPAFSDRMSVSADSGKQATQTLTVPKDGNWAVTDLVFENPSGSSGSVQWMRGNQVLLTMRLENFRDLDFHFITPQVFKENDVMKLTCSADSGTKCDVSVYYTGFFKNPPGS
jgi:hypothetical protein